MKKKLRSMLDIAALAVTVVIASAGVARAQNRTFEVSEDGASRARFTSDAPLETIAGVTSHVFGEFAADPAQLANSRGVVEVRTASLRTGIDLRDEHLRSDSWLDAARFPTIRFELTSVSGAARVAPNEPTRVTLHGQLTLHGRTREVHATGRITWLPEPTGTLGTMRIDVHLAIQLRDFGISIPPIVELKVSNDIGIEVNLRGRVRP